MAAEQAQAEGAAGRSGRRRLVLLAGAAVVLTGLGAAGLWFGGVLPPLPGQDGAPGAAGGPAAGAQAAPQPPAFLDLPEVVANLNVAGRRAAYVKLRGKLELARAEDAAAVQAAMPRVLDLFSTYLREMRPEELRGSAGTYRLREELLARVNIAVAPARVTDVLFVEILVQ
ncbi:flagellar basal body-associated FliL family protein [Caldovatus aquaticus]|uniref:Flagellar protein FliL n=1 Tax=Caldovatus aquaticus TaxID=2865671 RepID=A0ABS7F6L8_9PROT|nr:flagellar basal body-associated FliL family protein [Caldovatus aquaticus]MBW8271245.1 flagellar basal body-associated FliL family protein [Caldovatus aquaticus]